MSKLGGRRIIFIRQNPLIISTILVDNKKRLYKPPYILSILVITLTFISPFITHAGVFSNFSEKVKAIFLPVGDTDTTNTTTSQTIPLPKPIVVEENDITGGDAGDSVSSDSLSATTGSLRVSTEDIDYPTTDTISVYEVKKGDSLATVAKLFGVSKNTIIWANDLKSEKIIPGDSLVILPMTGIKHTVKKGDTVSLIAKKYKADVDDVAKFNGVATSAKLSIGDVVLVPEGEIAVTITTKSSSGKLVTTARLLDRYDYEAPAGFFFRPVPNSTRTQGLHGHNGIDFGAPSGTQVLASAGGVVIVAKSSGYNGGYGNMIVVSHDGGIQTVYAHLRSVYVLSGQSVVKGQSIGTVGSTGRSTGNHLHFEVRGAKNPF